MNEDGPVDSYYDDDSDTMEDPPCPKCRGRAYDRNGDPCGVCHGEGVILVLP